MGKSGTGSNLSDSSHSGSSHTADSYTGNSYMDRNKHIVSDTLARWLERHSLLAWKTQRRTLAPGKLFSF